MKQQTIVSIILILFISVFSLSADSLEKRNTILSFQGMMVEGELGAFGGSVEYFLENNLSMNLELMTTGHGSFVMGSLGMAWHAKLPSFEELEFMMGGGLTTIIPYLGIYVPNYFVGLRYYTTPSIGIFIKAQGYYSVGSGRTAIVLGISMNLKKAH